MLSYFKTILDPENPNYNENDIIKSFPGLYYFIIDQSGSMSGRPIQLVKQTLKVFMQSLSKGSYYQLIGFGSDYKLYSSSPLFYTKENVNDTLNQIIELKGDMGGTNLYKPMEYIYKCKKKNLHLPQHIFILTDGYTTSKELTLNLIEKNTSRYQVYSYGIGNDFDQDFIRTAGEVGYGSYKFINNIDNLSTIINEQLKKCMRIYYDQVKFNVENNNNNELIYDFYRNEFILENQLVNYSFNGNINIKNNYKQGEKEFNENFNFNENQIYTLKDGDVLSKITIHSLIQKGKGKDFSQEEKIKKIAKKYQVLCEYTSLFAEVENSQENKEGNLQPIINKSVLENINNSSLFGNNNNKQSNSLFGNRNNYKYNLFGNNNNQSNSLFGNSNNCKNNLFGNINNNQSNNLFGNSNKCKSNLFGNNNNNQSNSLFGNINNNHSSSLFGNNNNFNDNFFNNENKSHNEKEEDNKNLEESKILENIIMSLDIIEGFWEENQYTKHILDMKVEIYNKVKSLVNDNKIAVTFIILYYILNDRKDKVNEYSNIINKAKNFLINCGSSYEKIFSYL